MRELHDPSSAVVARQGHISVATGKMSHLSVFRFVSIDSVIRDAVVVLVFLVPLEALLVRF